MYFSYSSRIFARMARITQYAIILDYFTLIEHYHNFYFKEVIKLNFMNNLKVTYKLLILVIVAILAMILLGHGGYSVIAKSQHECRCIPV